MTRALAAGAFVFCACTPLEGPGPEQPLPYGGVKAYVATLGYRIDPLGSDSMTVALDSAISGYGLQPILSSDDSAMFNPVPIGTHQTTVRGIPAACDVESFFTSETGAITFRQYGPDREFPVGSGEAVIFFYFLRCGSYRDAVTMRIKSSFQ